MQATSSYLNIPIRTEIEAKEQLERVEVPSVYDMNGYVRDCIDGEAPEFIAVYRDLGRGEFEPLYEHTNFARRQQDRKVTTIQL